MDELPSHGRVRRPLRARAPQARHTDGSRSRLLTSDAPTKTKHLAWFVARFPIAVAAATSKVMVVCTVVGGSAPAVLGTGVQGKVSPRVIRWFFSGLFFTIGVTFLVAFTVFKRNFG